MLSHPGRGVKGLVALSLALAALPLSGQDQNERADRLRKLLRGSPKLQLEMVEIQPQSKGKDWAIDFVSSLAIDQRGVIYLFQRGLTLDPIIAVDGKGEVLRSWGKGLYKIPHSIRVDPAGNIWTVDAASSMVHKFTPRGKQLLEISVGGQPEKTKGGFGGTTDIAFAGNRVYVSDGYANARILEYSADGKLVRQWGKPGTGPGEFHLPHGIAIDGENIVYVADRENGRIQRFDLDGKYLGEWDHLGKTFSLKIAPTGELWIGTQPHNVANGVECWVVKVDRKSGKVLGAIESGGHHSMELNPEGEPLTGARPDKVLWFRRQPQ